MSMFMLPTKRLQSEVVLDSIVHQAEAGAYWKECCRDLMVANKISEEAVCKRIRFRAVQIVVLPFCLLLCLLLGYYSYIDSHGSFFKPSLVIIHMLSLTLTECVYLLVLGLIRRLYLPVYVIWLVGLPVFLLGLLSVISLLSPLAASLGPGLLYFLATTSAVIPEIIGFTYFSKPRALPKIEKHGS